MYDQRGQTKKGEKRGQDVGGGETHARQVLVGGNDHMVAEICRMKEAAAETGDECEGEPAEKYEQISKSPGH